MIKMSKIIIRIKNIIRYELNKIIQRIVQPQMVGGFKRFDDVYLEKTRISNTTYIGNKENLYLENNVFIGHYNYIDASNKIIIKEGCQITNFISIITHSSHISIRLYGREYTYFSDLKGYLKGDVFIGEYSFIGPHSLIMPNTRIGKGCIVKAYSNVKGEFSDFSIIAGNPAKIVGDTRKLDERYLMEYPDLQEFYDEWAKRD